MAAVIVGVVDGAQLGVSLIMVEYPLKLPFTSNIRKENVGPPPLKLLHEEGGELEDGKCMAERGRWEKGEGRGLRRRVEEYA